MKNLKRMMLMFVLIMAVGQMNAQIGRRFPAERKVIIDPVTGFELWFLTNKQGVNNSKIYQTHNQWTSDGQWLVFRSDRARGEALAVNEYTGDIVQITEGGYSGMLNVSRKEMKLYISRPHIDKNEAKKLKKQKSKDKKENRRDEWRNPKNGMEFVAIDLTALFADSEAGTMKDKSAYETILGITPPEWGGGSLHALDGDEKLAFFSTSKQYAAEQAPDMKSEGKFGPRGMGAGPSGLAYMDITTGKCHYIRSIPFQVGHVQGNPWQPGEVIFCWETGGKAPTRMWAMNADGSNYRPLYREASHDWVTHEAVISKDEIAFAVLGHRKISEQQQATDNSGNKLNPGQEADWGYSGTREYATGLAVVNMRTREFTMEGQIPFGSGFWHVAGSSDGNWVAGDDFARNIYLIDRHTGEIIHMSAGHKPTAKDHPHPTFKPDNSEIEIQSAMLQDDNRSMDICIIKLPWSLRKKHQNNSIIKKR